MKDPLLHDKAYSIETGKLHMTCPHKERTGINIHVVVKDGYCYRSEECMVIWCKYNVLQTDMDRLLSLVW